MRSITPIAAGLLSIVLYTDRVAAWGTLGHRTIAYIASSTVSSSTQDALQSILDSSASSYLANVSTWADSYRYTSAGAFSAPFHYIDANDSPPSSCSVDYSRDCGEEGCSISAILNYTSIMLDASSSADEVNDALRFVVHFVGDLHQPLHDEALEVGGNDINVTWEGDHTNLHHIWDTEIVQDLANTTSDSLSAAEDFANALLSSINTGEYGWNSSSWLEGISLNDTLGTTLHWAQEANAYVCSDVLVGGINAVESGDLSGGYFGKHSDVARTQIARAGIRLAAWLDLVVAAMNA